MSLSVDEEPETISPPSDTQAQPSLESQTSLATLGAVAPTGQRSRKARMTALVSLLVLIAAVAAGYAYERLNKPRPTQTNATSPTKRPISKTASPSYYPSASASYPSVLVFQTSTTNTSSVITLTGPQGSKIAAITASPSDATYDASPPVQTVSSALITTNKADTSFAVLMPDGITQPVSSTLDSFLSDNLNAGTMITSGNSTLFGVSEQNLTEANLLSGKFSTLLTFSHARPLAAVGGINEQIVTTSRDGKIAYLFAQGVTVNGTVVSGVSLISLTIATDKFTVSALPAALYPGSATVSNNGEFVAYQATTNTEYATHIYDVSTGKDTTVPGISTLFATGDPGINFSPDNSYLAETKDSDSGPGSAFGTISYEDLRIISVASGTVVHQLAATNQNLQGYRWAGSHSLIYTTQVYNPENYDTEPMAVHSMDASTGSIFNFPQLGPLAAVLNYQP
ncbi:MAG TPA: hypothetical protein VMS08_03190 [Candidatus Saccharimonadia bacterium]|nr:hypothetical protein [Candidatus Saccharimonadia bacterium]